MDAAKNQRKHSRLRLQLSAFLRLPDGREVRGQTRNISFGGAALTLDEAFPGTLDDRVTLGLLLDQGAPPVIASIICDVRRLPETHQVCVQYVATDLESYDHVRNIMLFNADNPDLLLEELTKHPGLAIQHCDQQSDGTPDNTCKECL